MLRPRCRHVRRAPAWVSGLLLGGAALCGVAKAEASFWDEFQRAREAAARAPDSMLVVAEARLAVDPDEFLAAWLAGRCATRASDSAAAVARHSPADSTSGPGHWVTRAALAMEQRSRSRARQAYERAASAYSAVGRPADAARALWFAARQAITFADSSAFDSMMVRAEAAARLAGDPAALADVLLDRGRAEYDETPARARPPREEAVRLLAPLGPSRQLANAHRGLGNVFKFAGDLDGAEREFRAALEVAGALGDSALQSQALGGLGQVQLTRAEFDEALASFTRAVELARGSAPTATMAARETDLAHLHLQLGHVRESQRHLDAAERWDRSGRTELSDRVVLLGLRASLAALAGRFDSARTVLDTAVAVATRGGAFTRIPLLRLTQAELADDLGEPVAALRTAEDGLAVAKAVGHRRAEVALRAFRAERLLEAGRSGDALREAGELTAACREANPRLLGTAARIEAAALEALGRPEAALARLRAEAARSATAGDSTDLARTLTLEAELLLQHRRAAEAERVARRAHAMLRAAGDTLGARLAMHFVGEALLARARPGESIRWLQSRLALEERVNSRLRASEDRAGHRSGWYEGAVALASAYASTGAPERALAVLERTRARELWRLLTRRATGLRAHVDSTLADAVEDLERELAAVQTRRLNPPAGHVMSAGEVARLDARIEALRTQLAERMRQVQRTAPHWGAAAAAVPTMDPRAMMASLRDDERVQLFMVGMGRTIVWRLDRNGLTSRVLPLGEGWWTARVAALVRALESGGDRRRAVGGLGDTLFGGWPGGAGVTRLHVVPDGPLYDLPFDALDVTLSTGGRRMLLDLAEVNLAPTAAVLFAADDGRPISADADVVAFGDPAAVAGSAPVAGPGAPALPPATPLANARREVQAIRAVFPRARVYVGAEATEGRLFEEARRATILHVAAHAFLDDRRPAFSGLALAPDRRDGRVLNDGLVQAFEVANAPLRAELATLSACETGTGTLRRGEGLQGLARAFQIAGVLYVVASRWRVEDAETADLMSAFYRSLADGATPAAALRSAKLESVARLGGTGDVARGLGTRPRRGPRAAAFSWAAFALTGPRSAR